VASKNGDDYDSVCFVNSLLGGTGCHVPFAGGAFFISVGDCFEGEPSGGADCFDGVLAWHLFQWFG